MMFQIIEAIPEGIFSSEEVIDILQEVIDSIRSDLVAARRKEKRNGRKGKASH